MVDTPASGASDDHAAFFGALAGGDPVAPEAQAEAILPDPGAVEVIGNRTGEGRIEPARAADVDIAAMLRRDTGFVTQILVARPRVSSGDPVAGPLIRAGRAPVDARNEARCRRAAFGVKRDARAACPTTFSGGERQKVSLARALILPQRLFLPEVPAASMDKGARRTPGARLDDLRRQGIAMVGAFRHPGDVADPIDREILPGET